MLIQQIKEDNEAASSGDEVNEDEKSEEGGLFNSSKRFSK